MYKGNSGMPHTRELPTHVLGSSEFTHTAGPSGLTHLGGASEFTVSLSKNICTIHTIFWWTYNLFPLFISLGVIALQCLF
jgi:hypothetical protein